MPAQFDAGEGDVRVAVAPLMEIESALCGIIGGRRARWGGLPELLAEKHPGLAERLLAFWDDRHIEWIEFFVVLEQAGLTLEPDPEPVLEQLPRLLARRFTVPKLPSEEPAVRDIVQTRVDHLAGSKPRRDEYCDLLRELWAVACPGWEAYGRGDAERMARDLRARLDSGEPVEKVLPPKHIALNDAFRPVLARGNVILTPLGLGGSAKYILQAQGGPVYVGFGPLERGDHRTPRREEAAAAFKLLSDPTRLGILEYLLNVPASVSDLARAFEVSQPTVSAHVKLLRDAGLLTSTRQGSHTLYRADREALRGSVERSLESLSGH
jgi:DNA-binding transcriptional ArsR family regulator